MQNLYLLTQHQPKPLGLLSSSSGLILDLSEQEEQLRFYSSSKNIKTFREMLNSLPINDLLVTFLGSGDFHHLSYALLERINEPFSLIVFDNHTDCKFLPPKFHCGNWLYSVAKLDQCKKIIHIGATQGLGWLESRLGLNQLIKKKIFIALPAQDLQKYGVAAYHEILTQIDSKLPIYISIDKDILSEQEVDTDWDQGILKVSDLLKLLSLLSQFRILGIDITGEQTAPTKYRNIYKQAMSNWEHPNKNIIKNRELNQRRHNEINTNMLQALGVR